MKEKALNIWIGSKYVERNLINRLLILNSYLKKKSWKLYFLYMQNVQ